MKPQRQLIKHNPESGQYGDCTRTCVAALLNLDADKVPHFGEGGVSGDVFWERVDTYLSTHGLSAISIPFSMDVGDLLQVLKSQAPNFYCLLGVGSPNADHSIIVVGDQLVCDPAGYDDLSRFKRDSENVVWVTFIVPSFLKASTNNSLPCSEQNKP